MPVHYELGARPDAEHVASITLDRSEARNACNLEHFYPLARAWKRFAEDGAARVAHLHRRRAVLHVGRGPEDPRARHGRAVPATQHRDDRRRRGSSAVGRHGCGAARQQDPKAIIVAVNGPCVAGGMEMLGGPPRDDVDGRGAARWVGVDPTDLVRVSTDG